MKVVFLDIDGVLNTRQTHNPRKLPYIVDKALVRRLKRLLTRTAAKVVLTTTWRYDPAGLFSVRRYGIPFIGSTPDFPELPRREEIRAWLKKHPRVTRYAVLDDDDDGLDAMPLFQPSAKTGLTPELAKGLGNFLLEKTDTDMRRNVIVRVAENALDVVTGHKG
jgi:hypothetical protein